MLYLLLLCMATQSVIPVSKGFPGVPVVEQASTNQRAALARFNDGILQANATTDRCQKSQNDFVLFIRSTSDNPDIYDTKLANIKRTCGGAFAWMHYSEDAYKIDKKWMTPKQFADLKTLTDRAKEISDSSDFISQLIKQKHDSHP
jgi:hypothetical protein